MNILEQIIISIVPIVIAVVFHEVAHGYVADRLGDPTPRMSGRLTLNPLPHIDPMQTVVIPLLLFLSFGAIIGGAKPVPVNPRYFANPKKDMVWVAAAGPGSNMLMALAAGMVLRVLATGPATGTYAYLILFFIYFMRFNLMLAVFNLIPIPPLDGSRIVSGFLNPEQSFKYNQLERYGLFIIIGIFLVGPMLGISVFNMIIFPFIKFFSVLFAGPAFF